MSKKKRTAKKVAKVAKKARKPKPEEPVPLPLDPASIEIVDAAALPPMADPSVEAENRLRRCISAVDEALTRYNCRVVPYMEHKQVGDGPLSEVIATAKCSIAPNAAQG